MSEKSDKAAVVGEASGSCGLSAARVSICDDGAVLVRLLPERHPTTETFYVLRCNDLEAIQEAYDRAMSALPRRTP
jgi:hypothetical protein